MANEDQIKQIRQNLAKAIGIKEEILFRPLFKDPIDKRFAINVLAGIKKQIEKEQQNG